MSQPMVRLLGREDISAVVKLLHESFDSRLRPFMPYTQQGIGDFLSVPLEYPDLPSDRTRLVAESQEEILGFADYRMLGRGAGHLSYICVKASARGRGVATAIITEFLRLYPQVEVLSLDVFRDNSPARALYRKLGFKTVQVSGWVTRSLPVPLGSVSIESIEASMAAYRRHGFCELDVRFEQQRISVGLIGPHVVRCFSVDAFENDALLAGLRQVFKFTEEAMVVVPRAGLANIKNPHKLTTLSDRMSLETKQRSTQIVAHTLLGS